MVLVSLQGALYNSVYNYTATIVLNVMAMYHDDVRSVVLFWVSWPNLIVIELQNYVERTMSSRFIDIAS